MTQLVNTSQPSYSVHAERRGAQRVAVDMAVVVEPLEGAPIAGRISDISETGMFVRVEHALTDPDPNLYSRVAVRLEVDGDGDPMEWDGVIVWSTATNRAYRGGPAGYGIELL